jgi:uncharacterized RDD family membrane protein YckC
MKPEEPINLSELEVNEADDLKRNASGFIDAAVVFIFYIIISIYVPLGLLMGNNGFLALGAPILALALYRLICIAAFHITIGMWLCRIRFLNGQFKPLSMKERIFAAFFILVNGVNYYQR